MAGVPDANGFEETPISTEDVVAARAEQLPIAKLVPCLSVCEGFALLEMEEHILQAIRGNESCHLLVAVRAELEEINVKVTEKDGWLVWEAVQGCCQVG